MIFTKKILQLLPALAFLVACGGGEPLDNRQPAEVAMQVYAFIASGEAGVVKQDIYFPNDDEREVFERYLSIVEASGGYKPGFSRVDYEFVSEEVSGDTAVVEFRGVNAFDKTSTVEVKLIKVDGAWKVDGSQAILHRK